MATGSLPGGGPLYGNAVLPPLGTRPAFAGKAPAARAQRGLLPQRAAEPQPRHDGNRAVKRAIRTHRFDFAAIVGADRRRDRA